MQFVIHVVKKFHVNVIDTEVESRLLQPRLTGLLNYPDFFLWCQIFQ